MSERVYTLEKMFEIWDDKTGECLEVGPDRDSLGLLELREKGEGTGKILARITLDRERARLLVEALKELLNPPQYPPRVAP